MSIWLYLSFFIGFLGLNIGQERWLLSFIPCAFFFGVFIENMKSGGNTIGAVAAWLFYGAGFLIAVLPLWISPKD